MAAKRLIKELEQYNKQPSPAVPRLEPTSDDDLFHLTAELRGPEGTAYEGVCVCSLSHPSPISPQPHHHPRPNARYQLTHPSQAAPSRST